MNIKSFNIEQIGGSMNLEFYDPKKCTRQHRLKEQYSESNILGSIIYLWSQPESYLIDNIMQEVLLGASFLKTRRKHLFPFHTILSKNIISVALRVANSAHYRLQETIDKSNNSKYPNSISLKRWKEWLLLLKNLIKVMDKRKIKSVCVGLV